MTYDEDNRLLTYNGQTVEYDAESVRTAKITGGVRTEYTTDRESTYSQLLIKTEYEKNVFGLYTEQKARTTYTYGTGLVSERRDGGEELYYHYNHLGSTVAVSDKNGGIVYRFVYDTYGELSDIQNGNKVSLKTAEETQEYTLAELADAAGIEYLYNGKYGVSTDKNGLYYMRARYYNQDIKRFINRDVLSGNITNSQSLNRYCYVQGNPVSLTDPFGLCPTAEEIRKIEVSRAVHKTLDVIGIFFDGADVINAIIYALEGDYVNAALCIVFFIPGVGSAVGLTVKYAFKIGGNAGEALIKFTKKYAPELAENGGRLVRNVGGKLDDAGRWVQRKSDDAWEWINKKLGRELGESGIIAKYSPINPGPLKEEVANTFNGAIYVERVLTEDTVMYRVSGGSAEKVGSYMSMTPQGGGLQSQLDLALNPAWGNTTENVTKVIVPKGTTIYEGIAAPQNIYDSLGNIVGKLPGGGNQIYIPTVEAGWFK